MDLNVIKQRLEKMNKQSSNSGGGGKNLFWKPSVGKQVVRVVPNKYNKSFPFTEMLFYYGIGPRVMASPQNWKEKDPIQEFTKQLRQSGDKENWRLAKKLDAKTRIFAPVIVRGMESEGVKLWQFGKEVYQEFLNMASDDEIGDYTDMAEGRDIKLTTVGPEVTGTPYNKTTIGPSLKTSPISNDSGLVQSILDNQPDPMGIFKKYTFDEVKAGLQEWLAPEDQEKEGEIISEPAVAFDSDKKTSANYSIDTSKQSKEQKFDDLFSDKKEESDDLPF
mgnify:CR=1 FL=1|tara:strand:- start:541 stop:1371 length:831 start_codon:yes stop_codon:yes gene_type:complete